LGNVDFAVQKGALAEFARSRWSAAELEQPLEQGIEHQDAAMSLQFQNVFAGIGGGRGEIQRQSTVERLTLGIQELCNLRNARRQQIADHRRSDLRNSGT
jgi:hypothetical protein